MAKKDAAQSTISSIKKAIDVFFSAIKNAFFHGVSLTAYYTMPEVFLPKVQVPPADTPYQAADVLLFPLTFVGACVGLTALPVLYYIFVVLKHSAISFYRAFAHSTNSAVKDMFTLQNNKKISYQLIPLENEKETRREELLVLGLVGRLLGLSLGLPAYIVIMLSRIIQNIPEHTFRIFCRAVRFMLPKESSTQAFFTLPPDKRGQESLGYGLSYSLGIFGIFPLGVVGLTLGLIVGSGLRASIEIDFLLRNNKTKPPHKPLDDIDIDEEDSPPSSYSGAMSPLVDPTNRPEQIEQHSQETKGGAKKLFPPSSGPQQYQLVSSECESLPLYRK